MYFRFPYREATKHSSGKESRLFHKIKLTFCKALGVYVKINMEQMPLTAYLWTRLTQVRVLIYIIYYAKRTNERWVQCFFCQTPIPEDT